ncbi:MAG: hypothetical protein ACLFPJ_04435 [Candidatus Woesearchaeota archaeon]
MYKAISNYNACNDCLSHKYSKASLLQPYKKLEMDAYLNQTPTYSAMPLKTATNYFLNNYIRSASKFYNTTKITDLRKNLNVTREGLSKIIKKTNTSLDDIAKTVNNSANTNYFTTNFTTNFVTNFKNDIKDPIERYFALNASKNGFDLKEDTSLFKQTYANNVARTFGFYNAAKEFGYDVAIELKQNEVIKHGINDAAKALKISTRRMQDFVKQYYTGVKGSIEKIITDENIDEFKADSFKQKETELEKAEKQRVKEIKQNEQKEKEKIKYL